MALSCGESSLPDVIPLNICMEPFVEGMAFPLILKVLLRYNIYSKGHIFYMCGFIDIYLGTSLVIATEGTSTHKARSHPLQDTMPQGTD